jgi:twinkle protein
MEKAMIFADDVIDFNAYIAMTDHDHRVRPASSYIDSLNDRLFNPAAPKGAKLPFKKMADKLRFRKGEVTIWTGFNGHGKSLLLGQAVLGFVAQNERVCVASMEMLPEATLERMVRQGEGASRPSREFVDAFLADDCAGQRIWLYDQMGMVNPEKIAAVGGYAADKRGCTHFVVDSLLKCGMGEDDYNGQKRFVDRLCTLARDTGIHVHLVCHSRKGRDELTPPGKMDVRGAASITDQVDNVITVWRNKVKEDAYDTGKGYNPTDPDALMIVSKQRHGDWEKTCKLWFDTGSQQFIETHESGPINLLHPGIYA